MIGDYNFFTSGNLDILYGDLHSIIKMAAPGIMIVIGSYVVYRVLLVVRGIVDPEPIYEEEDEEEEFY